MGPIYHLYIVRGFREAYYQLSSEKRDQFWTSVAENDKVAGAKYLVGCYSRWGNEAYPTWGVVEYPDLAAIQQSTRANEKIQHFRYIEAETYNGILTDDFQIPQISDQDQIYQLFLVKNQSNEAWTSLAEDTRNRIFSAVGESIQNHGGIPLIGCEINWSNEEYSFFGVTAWPSIEAEQAHFKDLANIGWHRYFYGRTLLGTKYNQEI